MRGLLLAALGAPAALAAIQVQPSSTYSRRASSIFSGRGFFVGAAFVGNSGWDPLNLATAENLVPLRHAEIKHGRLAMMAASGWLAAELVHDGAAPTIFNGGLSSPDAAPALACAIVVSAAFELREIQLRQRAGLAFTAWAPDSVAGHVAFDPMKIAADLPVTDRFELQQAEVINGRLACLALVAFAVIEGMMGVPIVKFSPDMIALW